MIAVSRNLWPTDFGRFSIAGERKWKMAMKELPVGRDKLRDAGPGNSAFIDGASAWSGAWFRAFPTSGLARWGRCHGEHLLARTFTAPSPASMSDILTSGVR